ncbi:MAG: hypothetical protein Hens3KO_13500 [Henriciella sp.]
MAFSNPDVYVSELARPLFERFEAEPSSYDLAISCCIILYHFSDVLGYVRRVRPHEAAELITERVPAFATVRAIANAGKHVELTRHPNSELIGLRAEHLMTRRDEAASPEHAAAIPKETIVVTTPDSETYDVLSICRTALIAIEKEAEFFYV